MLELADRFEYHVELHVAFPLERVDFRCELRVFVQLRQTTRSNTELAEKIDALEYKYDARFKVVFRAIRDLMAQPRAATRRIGFSASSRTSGS